MEARATSESLAARTRLVGGVLVGAEACAGGTMGWN